MKLAIALLFVILGVKTSVAGPHGDAAWCYKDANCGPLVWSTGSCKKGIIQSPIDIISDKVHKSRTRIRLRFNNDYMNAQPSFYIKNNGHTSTFKYKCFVQSVPKYYLSTQFPVQLQLKTDLTSTLILDGDGLQGSYVFSQLHPHWGSNDTVGSEHTVNGKSYPLELHFVHYNSNYSGLGEAVTDANHRALAVFGVFFELSPNDNPNLTPIVDALPLIQEAKDELVKIEKPLNISALYPSDKSLFRYYGSLTTPKCFEIVHWNVFKQPVPISKSQLEAFRKLKDDYGHSLVDNFRPTLPLHGRNVTEFDVVEMSLIPAAETESQKPFSDPDYDETFKLLEPKNIDNKSGDGKKNGGTVPELNLWLLLFVGAIISRLNK